MKGKTEKEKLSEWVRNWDVAGTELEKLRREKIRSSIVSDELIALTDATESALLLSSPPPTSGLVKLQKWFKLLRIKNASDN